MAIVNAESSQGVHVCINYIEEDPRRQYPYNGFDACPGYEDQATHGRGSQGTLFGEVSYLEVGPGDGKERRDSALCRTNK